MPTLDGIRLASLLQFLVPKLKVVVVSGCLDKEAKQELKQYGFNAILHKPVSVQQLSAALQSEVSGSGAVDHAS
jgi:DNA-binding NarL/FixJ family response regulator